MFTFWIPAALKPWAKTLNTLLASAALIVLHGLVAGEWDTAGLEAVAAGVLSTVVFATSNDDV